MRNRTATARITYAALLLPAFMALPALAQLTVQTDRDQYEVGAVVTIVVHNAGPGAATLTWDPPVTILRVEPPLCMGFCMGFARVWMLPSGGTLMYTHDTAARPDPPALYEVHLAGSSPDKGAVLTCEYVLQPTVSDRVSVWGTIKCSYR